MPNIFGWLHYIDPTYYAFENVSIRCTTSFFSMDTDIELQLFVNEFVGLSIACDGSYIIPNVTNADPRYQTCRIQGAQPGQVTVPGSQYAEAFGWRFDHRWRNIGIMIAIAVIYVLAGALGSEIMIFTPQGGTPIVYTKKSSNSKGASEHTTDTEKEAAIHPSSDNSWESNACRVSHDGPALTWKDLTVEIRDKRILKGITSYVRPGDFIALCGASGAGKTTLLTALSQTNFAGQLGGEVSFGGKEPSRAFRRATGQQLSLSMQLLYLSL